MDRTAKLELGLSMMRQAGESDVACRQFAYLFQTFIDQSTPFIDNSMALPARDLPHYRDVVGDSDLDSGLHSSVVFVRLNGGLGTSMGLESAKSLISVKEGKSFLELALHQTHAESQAYGHALPLWLLSSFYTEEETQQALSRLGPIASNATSILQHRIPRLNASTLSPIASKEDDLRGWCPPGHGDLYSVFFEKGVLHQALASGKRYLFVSNCDNLGATMDPAILAYVARERIPFLMEVVRRTEADKKGGHLAQSPGGQIFLRERAQCAPSEIETFESIGVYEFFNTNNLWIEIEALVKLLEEYNGILPLPVIPNYKSGPSIAGVKEDILQLEVAMGSAVVLFPNARALEVDRSRFLPVKTTEDLLLLMSDRYVLSPDGRLSLSPRCVTPSCHVQLDPEYFGSIENFSARFPDGVPSLIEASQFCVQGDVSFEGQVRVVGDVVLYGNVTGQRTIRKASVLKRDEQGEMQ